MNKFLYILLTLLLLLVPHNSTTASTKSELRIGLTGKYPPFNYYNETGKLVGFDVDVAEHICKNLERKCKFVPLQWDGILAALLSNKIDLIIGSMAITEERQKQALFSETYYESGAQIFATDPNQDIESKKFKIGVTLGTTYETSIRERLPQAEIRTYKGDTAILQDIQAGRLDAIITDRLVGGYMIREFGVNLGPIGAPLYLEKIGIPARMNDQELINQINPLLISFKESTEYNSLMQKYFGLNAKISTPDKFNWTTSIKLLGKGLLATLKISTSGLSLGIIFSVILAAIMVAGFGPLQVLAKLFTDFFRSTPFLIQLFGIYFGLPSLGISLSPFAAAVLTMGLHSSAYLSEVLVAGYHSVSREQRQAGQLIGLTRWQIIRHIIFPQMVPVVSAPTLNTIVAMIKDSAIVSVISVYELTMQAQQLISATYRPFEFYFLTAVLYGCITYPLILAGRRLDKKMQQRGGIA